MPIIFPVSYEATKERVNEKTEWYFGVIRVFFLSIVFLWLGNLSFGVIILEVYVVNKLNYRS